MEYPGTEAYRSAICNPRTCFRDPVLREGQVESDDEGEPIGRPGNLGIVFRMTCGEQVYAIKCFTHEQSGRQARYEEISAYLRAHHLPNFTTVEYLREGILVDGAWYPILRMAWVEGRRLDEEIEYRLQQNESLRSLIVQLPILAAEMQRLSIGHGDNQHANMLVDAKTGRIMLVDYDDLFTPALAQANPHEDGHPHYQHPDRIAHGYYAEDMDRFSFLVLYLSLAAIEADRALWWIHHGREYLIFTSADFLAPGATPIWARLEDSPSAVVRNLARDLQHCCQNALESVPPLSALLDDGEQRTQVSTKREQNLLTPTPSIITAVIEKIGAAVIQHPLHLFTNQGEWDARRSNQVLGLIALFTTIITFIIMLILYILRLS